MLRGWLEPIFTVFKGADWIPGINPAIKTSNVIRVPITHTGNFVLALVLIALPP
jgi:hypothetical protein